MDLNNDFWRDTYYRNIKKLIGICFRYVSDRHIAEDLAHDSFLTAMKKSDTFRSKGHFDAWLRKITVNTALQHLREIKTIQANQQELLRQELINKDEKMYLKHDFSTQELLEVINKLPEHHRLVFNLYVIDGCSHKQIAEKLNISEGTSKSHLARAKKKLQLILNKKQDEKRTKKSIFLVLFPCGFGRITRLYRTHFSGYEIEPQNASFLYDLDWNQVKRPRLNPYFNIINGTVAFGIVVIITGIISLSNKKETIDLVITPLPQQSADTVSVKADPVFETKSPQNQIPVVVKKKRITHKKVIVRDTLFVIDTANEK